VRYTKNSGMISASSVKEQKFLKIDDGIEVDYGEIL
jgi:hypothetical protein